MFHGSSTIQSVCSSSPANQLQLFSVMCVYDNLLSREAKHLEETHMPVIYVENSRERGEVMFPNTNLTSKRGKLWSNPF